MPMQGRVGVSLIALLFSLHGAANAQDLLTTTSPEDLVRSLTPGGGSSGGSGEIDDGTRGLKPAHKGVLIQGGQGTESAHEKPADAYQQPADSYQKPADNYAAATTNSYGDKVSATVNLAVTFRLGSAELTPDARYLLDSVGKALQSSELSNYRFLIGGHTDAIGSDYSNLELSRRRAESATNYLVEYYHVDPHRLVVRAFGEDALLYPDYPDDGRNRRVEISTLQ
jgi:outer membrane protein OmpA-like peptidoglycan-associated protein